MESNVEQQLRTTLHCDDKDKLRRKLALLQREYLRTAQRLQRAERLDVVRTHVRSRIAQQNHQDQTDPETTSNPCPDPSLLTLNPIDAAAQDPCLGHTEGPADCDNVKRTQVIRFQLPSDAACPQTPDPSHDAAGGHRASPSLRLRSRRSRLRLQRRSTEVRGTPDNSEEGQELGDSKEGARTEAEEEKPKSEGTEVVKESEEIFSASESESPSLLLTHWNTHVHTETGDVEGKETQGYQEQRENGRESRAEEKKDSESTSVLLKCWNSAIHTEERGQNCTTNGGQKETEGGEDGENSRGQKDTTLCEEKSNKDMEQNAAEKIENEKGHDNSMEIKEEKNGVEGNGKSVGLLDSCTLVEGLLFPAEYYVRTTRRMTLSQSQPDMQAVILSQLSAGRHRRSRGRGRGLSRQTGGGFSPLTPASGDPDKSPRVQTDDASAELTDSSLSSGEISSKMSGDQTNVDAFSSPVVDTTGPGRGRRRRRGRGRGRNQTPRSSLGLDAHQTSDDAQPISTPASPSPSLHGADGPKPRPTPGEPAPVSRDPRPVSTHSAATRPSSGADGVQCSPAAGHLEKLYPIFLKSSGSRITPTQTSRSTSSWQSLLLPSSPPSQTSLLPLPSLSSGPLVNNLMNFDIHQDFHLPDDQFASLKLHKLRQVAVQSGVERFASPSYNTRSSKRHSDACYSPSHPVMPLPLPLSLTPTISKSHRPTAEKRAAAAARSQNSSTDHKLENQPAAGEASTRDTTETLHAETHASSTASASVVQQPAGQTKEEETVTLNTHGSISAGDTHRFIDHRVEPQPPLQTVNDHVVGQSDELQIKEPASENQTDCSGVVASAAHQKSSTHRREEKPVIQTLHFDWPQQETPEEPSNSCAAAQTCNDSGAPGAYPRVISAANDAKESCERCTRPPRDRSVANRSQSKCSPLHGVRCLSPPPASAPCPFVTPHLPSSALPASPALPSLGLTPYPAAAAATSLPLTSSPSAPALALPPPHSPSTQALSPPALSPCPSIPSLAPGEPPASPSHQSPAASHPSDPADRCHRVEPVVCAAASSTQAQGPGGQGGPSTGETAEQHEMRCTHTLKAPAGGCLVDTCCLSGPSGGLYVAAAGKWAVCLWSQTSASDWSLIHTWTFNEPVINVFPVPDAAGLLLVTLGQLEIRQVRMLSCSSLMQVLLCEGVVQAVVGVSKSRVVSSSHSASGSTLRLFDMADSNAPSSQPLVSPGVCVGALAPVDGLSDALIGTDEGGRVFVWNLKTGQLLCRLALGDGLSHTACLRGYSYSGALFVLLQHQLLSSLEEEEKEAKAEDEIFSEKEERKKAALFSLVAVNPLSSRSVLATRLHPPRAWSGRLCEADVSGSSVVGLSQSGCACVWELGRRGASRMLRAPEGEGWQLARWGGRDTLVTGHHNGDVSLHRLSASPTPLCH